MKDDEVKCILAILFAAMFGAFGSFFISRIDVQNQFFNTMIEHNISCKETMYRIWTDKYKLTFTDWEQYK